VSSVAASLQTTRWTPNEVERWLSSHLDWLAGAALVIAFALRLARAMGTYLNPDEALHHLLVNQVSFIAAYRASLTNAHPPLYFALLYFWRFLSNSEVMLRLPSAAASTAAAWMTFRWIALVLGRTAGFVALLLVALSPVLTALGAEVRDYSVLLLLMASALYFLERAFRDHRAASIVYCSLFLYLAVLTHYSALWFTVAIGAYVLVRVRSLTSSQRLAWILGQLGAAAIYAWLYFVHISKIHGSPMEAEAMTGWLQALYYRAGKSRLLFLSASTVDVFQYLFGSRLGGDAALAIFVAALLYLFGAGILQKRRDLAAFGLLLLFPFVCGMVASLADVYPYGGTRHCTYLMLFAVAGVSFLTSKLARRRLLPILLLAALLVPYWYQHRLPDPQQMSNKDQAKPLMAGALIALRNSVPAGEPVFSDYQASILLAYYLGRDRPASAPRECGGLIIVQYGSHPVVVLNAWSATSAQLRAGLNSYRQSCDAAPHDSFWIFDAGWGLNLLDDLTQTVPTSVYHGQRFGDTISLFQVAARDDVH